MPSDYVSDFGERSELACDAKCYGNEARFLNDVSLKVEMFGVYFLHLNFPDISCVKFRNTGKYPNVEFNTRRDKNGELRQGIYVKQIKDAKEEGFNGVHQDEELLVSYGKR